jgi:hypothetical protein
MIRRAQAQENALGTAAERLTERKREKERRLSRYSITPSTHGRTHAVVAADIGHSLQKKDDVQQFSMNN